MPSCLVQESKVKAKRMTDHRNGGVLPSIYVLYLALYAAQVLIRQEACSWLHMYSHMHVCARHVKFKFGGENLSFKNIFLKMSKLLCNKQCPISDNSASCASCVAREKLVRDVEVHFGFKSFRPEQLKALLSVAHGKDAFV